MSWVFFSILASILFTAGSLLSRYLLKAMKDPWAYSFWFSLGGAVVCLPFMLMSPIIPTGWFPWALAVVLGILIVAHNYLLFTALHYIEASISGSIAKLRLIWVFIFGTLFLHEVSTIGKLVGITLTISAAFLIFHKFKKQNAVKGIVLTLCASVFNAGIVILAKYLLQFFNPPSLTFFGGFLMSAIINFLIMPRFFERAAKILKETGSILLFSAGMGGIANLVLYKALELGEATRVVVVIEAFLIITLVLENIILKEKNHLILKIFVVLLATAGAILISLGI